MFYLTTHSIHLVTVIWRRMSVNKEGSVLFNDALNTFSYGYMSSDVSDQMRVMYMNISIPVQ